MTLPNSIKIAAVAGKADVLRTDSGRHLVVPDLQREDRSPHDVTTKTKSPARGRAYLSQARTRFTG
jgi:hypothetical protein